MRRTIYVLAGVAAALVLVQVVPGFPYDFNFDWVTGRALLEGVDPHQPIVGVAADLGIVSEVAHSHPRLPGALVLNAPLGLIPYTYMYVAGRVLTVAAGLWLAWLVARWGRFPVPLTVTLVPLALLLWPFSQVLVYSQWAIFVVAACVGITLFARDHWASGMPLAIAVTLKMWPWLLVPALWLSGRRRTAVGAAAGFAVFNGAVLLFPHVSIGGTVEAFGSVVGLFDGVNLSPIKMLPVWAGPVIGLIALAATPRRWRLVGSIPIALATTPILWPAYLPTLVVAGVLLHRQVSFVDPQIVEVDQPVLSSATVGWDEQSDHVGRHSEA